MPCPPLVPISIIPPVSQGVAPILWRNGNQITRLNIPLNPSFLIYDGTITRWGDGSAQAPVYLPNIQEVNSPAVTYVAGITATGQLVKTLGVSGTGLVGGSAGSVVYQSAPSATGFTAVGTTGQLLSSNGASAPTWLNQSAIAAGSLATARTISLSGDVTGTATSFNGSANITIPVTINAGSVTPADLSTGGPYWDTSGNVGIGTSTPISDLEIVEGTRSLRIDANLSPTGNSYITATGSTNGLLVGTTDAKSVSFFTNNTLRASVESNGEINTQANPIINCPTTAKAWVNFDGTIATPSTIRASYNVSSITRTANGDYTINFTTALADANYSALISAGGGPAETYISLSLNTLSVGSLRIRTFNAVGLANYSILSVAVFDN